MHRFDKIADTPKPKTNDLDARKVFVVLMLVMSLLGAAAMNASPAFSGEQSKREALIAAMPKGDTFENDGKKYVWLPTLRAARQEDATKLPLNEANLIDKQLIEKKGRFKIYGTATRRALSISEETSTKPVALNMDTKSFAVITGNLWLKLKDMRHAGSIAAEYGLAFDFANDAMQTAFYKTPADANIKELRERLKVDPRVELVTLDMVDRIRHPR